MCCFVLFSPQKIHKIVASQMQTGKLIVYFLLFSFLSCSTLQSLGRFICQMHSHPAWWFGFAGVFQDRIFYLLSFTLLPLQWQDTVVLFWLLSVQPSVAVANIYFFCSLLYGLQSSLHGRKIWLLKELFYQWKVDAVICFLHISYCVCNNNKTFILAF